MTVTKIVTTIIKSGYLSPKTGAYMKRITGNTVKLKEEKIMVCPKCGKEFDGILCASCGYAAEEEAKQTLENGAADVAQNEAEAYKSKQPNKCPKCGSEMTERFCTQCGTVTEELNECPVCSAPRKSADRYCGKCGYEFKKPKIVTAEEKQQKKRSLIIGAICLLVVIALAVVIPVGVVFTQPWHANQVAAKLDKINIGDTQEHVMSVLGEPYEFEEGDTTLYYYSDEYFELLDRLEEIGISAEDGICFYDIIGSIHILEELEQIEYKYIVVDLNGEGKVESVLYNAKAGLGAVRSKGDYSRAEILTKVYAYELTELDYSLEFTDGSVYKSTTVVYSEPSELSEEELEKFADPEKPYPYRHEFEVSDPFSNEGETIGLWTYVYEQGAEE